MGAIVGAVRAPPRGRQEKLIRRQYRSPNKVHNLLPRAPVSFPLGPGLFRCSFLDLSGSFWKSPALLSLTIGGQIEWRSGIGGGGVVVGRVGSQVGAMPAGKAVEAQGLMGRQETLRRTSGRRD